MADLVRHGLSEAQAPVGRAGGGTGEPTRTFDEQAARLVDAQAPGAARLVRELSGIAGSGEGWPARMLERLGLLHLLARGWEHRDALDAGELADLRGAIGYTQSQEELRAQAGVRDIWRVVGQRTDDTEDDRFVSQRTWLMGRGGAFALLLQFARGRQAFPVALAPGTELDAELVYFLSAVPLRALVKERFERPAPAPTALQSLDGEAHIADALAGYARTLARNPFHARHPLCLARVVPLRRARGGALQVTDSDGRSLPLEVSVEAGWRLLAVSGGHPLSLFGEWNGARLLPLGALWEGGYLAL